MVLDEEPIFINMETDTLVDKIKRRNDFTERVLQGKGITPIIFKSTNIDGCSSKDRLVSQSTMTSVVDTGLDPYKLTKMDPTIFTGIHVFMSKRFSVMNGAATFKKFDVYEFIKNVPSKDDFTVLWSHILDLTNNDFPDSDVNFSSQPSLFTDLMKRTLSVMYKITDPPFTVSVVDENGKNNKFLKIEYLKVPNVGLLLLGTN